MHTTKPVLLLTGGFGALGQIVLAVALEKGYRVAIMGQGELTDRLAGNPDCLQLQADLSNEQQVSDGIAAIFAHWHRIDALVNVAGSFAFSAFEESKLSLWEKMFQSNVLSAVVTARAVLPYFQKEGKGCIVFIGAMAAKKGMAGMSAYTATKSALARLSEALAEEVKSANILVHTVLPTVIDTPANRAAMPDADTHTWQSPVDIADAILVLLERHNMENTGALLPIAGLIA